MSNPNAASRFDEIYSSTSKEVLSFITSKCKYTADINDIFQETYLERYQVLMNRGADHVRSPKPFVMRIVKRKIYRYYSLLERLKFTVAATTDDGNGNEIDILDYIADEFISEDFVVDSMLLESVKRHIRSKPEDVKKIFYLFYDFDKTIPEIAKALGMSESNVKNKLYRTIKELREKLS